MPNWKKVAVSGSAASFSSLSVDTSITASTISASQVTVDGSLQVTGSTVLSGSVGTTVFSSNIDTMILTGSLVVTGSIQATGSLEVQGGITGSLFGTASYALTASSTTQTEFIGTFTGSFSGSLYNLQNTTVGHIPFFSQSQILTDSAMFQVVNGDGSDSIVINQNGVTAAAPEALYVYQDNTSSYNVISGKGDLNNYLQLNIQNTNNGANASSDIVATANNGNESTNFIDLGINNANFFGPIGGANDAYLYSTGQNLHIGNVSEQPIQFFVSGTDSDNARKFELNSNNQHNMTGSLNASQGFTGSLFGTASAAISASYAPGSGTSVSSSYSLTASYVDPLYQDVFITGTLSVNGDIRITNIGKFYGTASQAVSSSYALSASYAPGSETSISASYASSSSYAASSSYSVSSSYVISASYTANSTSASYALTASYVANASSFPYTGSAVISGSLDITGSFNITGSTTQVGNNTLIGSTVLSGSVAISGSQTFTGVATQIGNAYFTGSVNITGSTTQIGNNTLLGNTTLSGSIIMSGSQGQPNPTISVFGDLNQTGYTRYLPVTNNLDTSISASYIYVSGSTQDLYFSQNSKGYANSTRLRWIEGNLYTGLLNGGVITSASSTVYQVSSGSGIIVNLNASLNDNPYPTIQYLNWGNLTQSIAPLSASYDQAFVGIQSNGTIFQQGSPFSDGQFDTLINIGVVLFQNNSTINGVKTQPSTAYGFEQAQNTFNRAFGPLKLSGYTVAVSGSSTGSIVVGSGTAYSPGSNYVNDPNNSYYTTDSGTNTSKFFRYYQSGSGNNPFVYLTNGGAGYPNLDPVYYDNNGTLDTVGTSNYSIQRLFWYPNSVTKAVVTYYGNARYGTMSEGIANLNIEPFTEAPNTAANAIYLGAYVIKGGTNTTLQNPAHYTWIPGGLFRSVGGSGGGGSIVTQTLAGLSDVSISGQTDGQPLAYSATAGKWINSTYISASVAGNATSATSASFASTSSWALNSISSSYALTASYVQNAQTASYVLRAVSSSYALTASYVQNAQTASYILNAVSSSYSLSSSYALSASNAQSASYVLNAVTASFVTTAQTASYVLNAVSASRATSASNADTASFVTTAQTASYVLNAISASRATSAANADTASYVLTAQTASYVLNAVSASRATSAANADTASYVLNAISASNAATASYANSTATIPFNVGGTSTYYGTVASSIVGSNNLFTVSTGSYTAAKFLYTAYSGSNSRAGEIIATWNGGNTQFTDFSTLDNGTTTAVTSSVVIITSQLQFNFQTNTSGWTIKSQGTLI